MDNSGNINVRIINKIVGDMKITDKDIAVRLYLYPNSVGDSNPIEIKDSVSYKDFKDDSMFTRNIYTPQKENSRIYLSGTYETVKENPSKDKEGNTKITQMSAHKKTIMPAKIAYSFSDDLYVYQPNENTRCEGFPDVGFSYIVNRVLQKDKDGKNYYIVRFNWFDVFTSSDRRLSSTSFNDISYETIFKVPIDEKINSGSFGFVLINKRYETTFVGRVQPVLTTYTGICCDGGKRVYGNTEKEFESALSDDSNFVHTVALNEEVMKSLPKDVAYEISMPFYTFGTARASCLLNSCNESFSKIDFDL